MFHAPSSLDSVGTIETTAALYSGLPQTGFDRPRISSLNLTSVSFVRPANPARNVSRLHTFITTQKLIFQSWTETTKTHLNLFLVTCKLNAHTCCSCWALLAFHFIFWASSIELSQEYNFSSHSWTPLDTQYQQDSGPIIRIRRNWSQCPDTLQSDVVERIQMIEFLC